VSLQPDPLFNEPVPRPSMTTDRVRSGLASRLKQRHDHFGEHRMRHRNLAVARRLTYNVPVFVIADLAHDSLLKLSHRS
jgi:hypothetical protein